jgi:hypothetical protein
VKWWKSHNRSKGSKPQGLDPIVLYPNPNAQYFYQEKWSWPWPNVPAHEQRSALVNAWMGNQLPGLTNFIPGVPASYSLWNIPVSYANTLVNQQFNSGLNIQLETPVQQADLLQQAITNWQNRVSY